MANFWLGPIASARGCRVFGYDEIGSTSSEAAKAAEAGDVGDVWFAALRQTAGRGRRGRTWETPSGNLAASLLIVPDCDPAIAATLGFVAGIALNRALIAVMPKGAVKQGIDGAESPHHRIALKWPNDLLADGAKLAGILLEAHQGPTGRLAVVIGIGVNIQYAPSGLPYPATSLRDLDVDVGAQAVFAALADEWVAAYDTWANGRGVAQTLSTWRSFATGIGAEVAVKRESDIVRGVFETIDDSGRLIVRANDNSRIAISAGDVHFGVTASARI